MLVYTMTITNLFAIRAFAFAEKRPGSDPSITMASQFFSVRFLASLSDEVPLRQISPF